MTGFPQRSRRRNTACPASARFWPPVTPCSVNSLMSAPATKALLPVPVTMTPRIAGSVSIRVTASPSSAMTMALRALSLSGRLMVTRAMPSVRSNVREDAIVVPSHESRVTVEVFRSVPNLHWCRLSGIPLARLPSPDYLLLMPTTIPEPIAWSPDRTIRILDQTLLPEEERYLELRTLEELTEAIRSLRVRGAPLIGIAAAMGVAMEAGKLGSGDA